MLNALARPKKTKMMVNGGGIPLTASGSAVAPAVSPLGAKKPRKPTVKKEKDDAAGSASGVAAAAVAAVQVATPEKPEKPERGKGRPRKIRPLEPGTTAAAAAAAAAATTAAASAAAAAAAAVSSANTLTPNGVGTPNAAASSSSASQPKNLSSVTARRRQEKEENAPFPWKPNSVKPIRMDPRTGQIAVGDPDSQCPPGFVDCWPCPQAGCNERHASDRQLATHIRMAHDDGKWRCPLYPGECNKTYKLAHHVALHYSGVHEGVRHHACTWEGCGLFFLNRGGLMQHYNFIHLKRNVDPATGKMVSSPSLATHSAPSGKPSKRKRGRSVDDSAVPGGAHAATAVSDGDDMSTAPESPIAAVRRSASTTGLARGRPRNSAVPVDRGTRADDEDDDDGDDDDDDDDEHVVADGHAPPDAARRASESQWRAEAAAASAQRQMMRASAPHPALEMDFDIADHHFDHFKHTSAFEAPNDSFGFLPSFNDEDTHATMMLQSDDMLGGHDAFGPIHHDHDLSARTQRGVGGSDRKTNGHFAGDVDALALDEDHFGNGQSLAIPPV
jgi:hypothetical protein